MGGASSAPAAAPNAGITASAPPQVIRRQMLTGAPVPGATEAGDAALDSSGLQPGRKAGPKWKRPGVD